MTKRGIARVGVGAALVLVLIAATVQLSLSAMAVGRTHVVAYFVNSNGIFVGDVVSILGVPVGKIDKIEPQTELVKISFWFEDKYRVPADAKAVILSPALVTARVIQLTPAYTGGPQMQDNAVISAQRTAVPMEWDDLRQQLEKLVDMMQPTEPGGVSPLGSVVTTTADNLRGQGATIRDSIIKLSKAITALGDHSDDVFSSVKNLSILVSALQTSGDLMRQLNTNLASVSALLANDPNEIGEALAALNGLVSDVQSFVADNREALGATADKMASVSDAVDASLDDLKQTLHVAPNALQNFMNIYQPAQGTLSGATGAQQLRQSTAVPVRGDTGGVSDGRRRVGKTVCPVSGADRQEPAVQLPSPRRKPGRRRGSAAERGHLQRGLDAAGLRSATGGCGRRRECRRRCRPRCKASIRPTGCAE